LAGISSGRPLLLILDDLQWVDHVSVDLLFQLGRQLSGKRLLIVVAYRPEDVATGREGARHDGGRHPLQPLVEEFKRLHGDITLDLAEVEGRSFVDDFVDSEPNNLDQAFRDRLFRRTGGHALFTVELLRDMQERGDLVSDEKERWTESPTLDWDNLPARIEGVIESRIGRLEESLREILTVAAVEGESFTAQVIARVQEIRERKILRSLSRELALRHHLVNERVALLIGKQMLARYRFAHALFQRYFYNEISPVERRLLHGEIAVILEEIYGDQRDTIAVQLSRHYLEAGDGEKAMKYLLLAGDQARQMSAHQESIEHYQAALSLAEENRHLEKAARILMKLGQTYGLAMEPGKASEIYQRAFIAWQRASAAAAVEELTLSVHPLRLEYSVPVKTLDPMMATHPHLVRLLFNGLTQITLEGDVLPDVAERWEILEGGKTYTFHLRQDVYWRDGRPVTAYDFVYAWQRILHPDNKMAYSYLEKVRGAKAYNTRQVTDWLEVGVQAKDDATLVIELEEPVGYFLLLLTLPGLYPVPMHIVEKLGQDWASSDELISNGAFFLQSWPDQDNEVMTFLRNPRYHGRVVGNVGQVVLANLRQMDEAAYYSEPYESNQIDVLRLTPIELKVAEILIKRFADDHVSAPALSTMYIALDSSKPPLDDVRVRQAMAMTIDRWANVETMFEVATGGLVPPGMGGHSPGIAYEFDPEKARELLKPVGDTQLRKFSDITVLSGGPELLWAVEHWRRYLGLQLSSQKAPWSEVFNRWSADPPQIYIAAWSADYPDPDNFLRIGMSKIRQLWNHPEYEALIVEAGRELNGSRRLELYQKADRILIEEAVVIPIFYVRIHSLVKPWIHNWSLPTFTATRLENVIIEPH
jgi:ABC-type oligopeptide transport system substrate-binding subunit